MARLVVRILCLGLILILTAATAVAKPKAKAKKTQDSANASSSAAASPAVPPPGSQDSGLRRTFSFSAADEPLNPQPSLFGFPGLWKAIGAQALPPKSFGGSAFYDRINRNPGFLTISDVGWSGFVSLHERFALAGRMTINRRILMRRADQLSFGQERLATLFFGACPFPKCFPSQLTPIVRFPGPAGADFRRVERIPILRDTFTGTGALLNAAGFYNLYPWVNRRSQNGVGEVNLSGHINLWGIQEGTGVAVALRPNITIPTRFPNAGDIGAPDAGLFGTALFSGGRMIENGVQTGAFQYGMDLLIEGHAGSALGLYANIGFNYIRDPKENDQRLIGLRNDIPVRIGINVPRTSRLQLLLEYTADHFVGGGTRNRGAEDSEDWIADATAGFRAYLTPWLSLSGGYRHTINQWGGDKHGFVGQLAASYIPIEAPPAAPVPPTVTCTADATTVRPGQEVRLTATASTTGGGTLSYTWTTTGGRIEGQGPTARLDTTGLAPGTYTVTVRVSDSRGGFADCTVQIRIEAPPPPPPPQAPTVTCTVDRTTVRPGEVVNLTATGRSPDNRPLNYDWTVTGGRIEGSGANVRWDLSNVSSGTYTATVRVTDDRGMSADCSVSVTVQAPEVRRAQKLNECNFRANSARVDNVCKAVLDDVALRLQSESGSRAIVVGHKTGRERAANLAAQRASNVKHYLVQDKGIDSGRIEVRTGTEDASKVEVWLVPQGGQVTDVPGSPATETAAPRRARKAPARKAAGAGAPR